MDEAENVVINKVCIKSCPKSMKWPSKGNLVRCRVNKMLIYKVPSYLKRNIEMLIKGLEGREEAGINQASCRVCLELPGVHRIG